MVAVAVLLALTPLAAAQDPGTGTSVPVPEGTAPVAVYAPPAPAAGSTGALPPEECVRLLRSARVAAMKGDWEGELARLREAAERFPDEIAPLTALLERNLRHPLPEDEYRRLRGRLFERLGDPDLVVPPGVLEQMASDPKADEDTLRAMAAKVAAQLDAPAPTGSTANSAAAGPNAAGPQAAAPSPRLLSLLGELQERLGEDEAAFDTWKRLWTTAGSEVAVGKMLRLAQKLHRWPEIVEALGILIDRGATGLRRAYVEALIHVGRIDEGLAQLDLVLAEQGVETPGRAPIAAPLAGGGRSDDLGVAEQSMAEERPGLGVASLLVDVAWQLRDAGRDADAERLFRRALALSPRSTSILAVLLHLYGSDEEREAQAEALEQRWEKESDPRALLDEGTQRLAAGDVAGALELLKRAAPEYPDLEAPWYNLGIAAFRQREWETAERAYRRAAELNPGRAESFYFRGVALTYLDRCPEALAALEHALKLDPARTDAHYHLATCYKKLGDVESALRHRRLYEGAKGGG